MSKCFTAHRGKVPARAKAAPRPDARTTFAKTRAAPTAAGIGDSPKLREIGGPAGPEPTRYGDWERKGICVDF